MADEKPNELTTTLHLVSRQPMELSENPLTELLESFSPEDRTVIEQVQASKGRTCMVLIARGAAKGSRYLITDEGATIGRSVDSGIFLDDITVSRSHARITKSGDAYFFSDAGSLNGTYMNNRAIENHQLVTGDEFQIGKFHLIFIGSN